MTDLAGMLAPTGSANPMMGQDPMMGLSVGEPTGMANEELGYSIGASPLALSPRMISQQFQAIAAFNQSSPLPNITPGLTLDMLASPELPDAPAVSEFLYGLESDLRAAEERVRSSATEYTSELVDPATAGAEFMPESGFLNQARRVINDVSGAPWNRPTVVPGDPSAATIDFKREAIERGLLPRDTPIDGSWNSSLNNAYYDLGNEITGEKLKGIDKVGAFSLGDVGTLLDDWLSPTSLLSAAVAMDFLPNLNAIADETSGWGDAIGKFIDDPSSFKNFVGALGPIDDIAFPLLNAAMLMSGVGAGVGFYRAGRAVRGLAAVGGGAVAGGKLGAGVLSAAKEGFGAARTLGAIGGQVAPYVDDVARMSQPGLLGSRLQKGRIMSAIPGADALGRGMGAWRQFEGVQNARFAVAQGMKLGVLSMIEQEINPDRRLGLTIPGLGNEGTHRARVAEMKQWRTSNPLVLAAVTALEPAFTPVSILRHGAITGPIAGVAKAAKVRFIGVSQDEYVSAIAVQALQRHITTLPAAEQALYAKLKPADQVVAYLTKAGDVLDDNAREVAGQKMLFALLDKAIDKQATQIARALVSDPASQVGSYERIRLAVRGHLEQRLRQVDDVHFNPAENYQDARMFMGWRSGMDADDLLSPLQRAAMDPTVSNAMTETEDILKIRRSNVENMMADFSDPVLGPAQLERARNELKNHQQWRTVTAHDLLDKLDENDVYEIFDTIGPSLRNDFEGFIAASDMADNLDDLRTLDLLPTFSAANDATWLPSVFGENLGAWLPTPTGQKLAEIDELAINPMQRAMRAGHKAVTVQRLDTPDRVEIGYLQESLYRLTRMHDSVKNLGGQIPQVEAPVFVDDLETFASNFGDSKRVSDLTEAEIQSWAEGFQGPDSLGLTDGQVAYLRQEFAPSMAYFSGLGLNADDMVLKTEKAMDAMNASDFWKKIDPIQRTIPDERGIPRSSTLQEKVAQLREVRDLTGATVDLPPEVAAEFAARGYRVVAGDQFFQFRHVSDMASPLADVRQSQLTRMSLGTFTTRTDHESLNKRRRQIFGANLLDRVQGLKAQGRWGGPENFEGTTEEVDELVRLLSSHYRAGLETLASGEEMATGAITTTFARAARQGVGYSFYDSSSIKILDAVLNDPKRNGIEGLQGWDKASLRVLRGALLKSRNVGWEYRGLAAIGDRMASESWLRGGLKMFSYSEAGQALSDYQGWKRAAKTAQRASGLGTHRDLADGVKLWRSAGYASLGAAMGGLQAALDPEAEGIMGNPLAMAGIGALGGGVAGAIAAPGTFTRVAGRAGMGLAGAAAGSAVSDDDNAAAYGFAAGVLPGFAALRWGATNGVKMMETNAWGEYARLYEPYERIRNAIRFSLSPIWDLQRYTEGWVLSNLSTYTDSDGVIRQVPGSLRPWKEIEKQGGDINVAMTEFQAAARGQEWQESLTLADAYVSEIGLLGYSPTKAMAATHWQLVRNGVNAHDAVGMVKDIFQFGEKARTGVEQSVNFVFFPFSFQKHYLSTIVQFGAEDIGRTVMVHNAIKLYSELEAETGFHDIVEKHLPVLDQLRKINSLNYGISPGQFGGINRPTWNLLRATPGFGHVADAFVNGTVMAAFAPTGVKIETKASAEEMRTVAEQMTPFWRDTADLLEDLSDQGYVATSSGHMRRRAHAQQGWDQWSELRSARDTVASELGISVNEMMTRDNLQYASIQRMVETEKRKLFEDNGAFAASYEKSVTKSIERTADLRSTLVAPRATEEEMAGFLASGRTANPDLALVRFEQLRDLFSSGFEDYDLEELPVSMAETLRAEAIRLAVDAPRFLTLYDRFYSRALGPIEKEIR